MAGKALRALPILISLLPFVGGAAAARAPFDDVAPHADLVFVGHVTTVTGRELAGGMIVTDVTFDAIDVVRATPASRQAWADRIVLTLAGGEVGGRGVLVSAAPRPSVGRRYLVFAKDDGHSYLSPILPGGLFPVRYEDGNDVVLLFGHGDRDVSPLAIAAPPQAADGASSARSLGAAPEPETMTLAGVRAAMEASSERGAACGSTLRLGGRGAFLTEEAGRTVRRDLPLSRPAPRRVGPSPVASVEARAIDAGTLGACGYHTLNLVMEQVPTSWWSYPINNDSMYVWNQFMDVYRYTPDDGSFGDNGQNEFCGWVDDPTLQSVYGFTWNGAYATTISWYYTGFPCGEITQSDVLWNPAYQWTDSFTVALGNPGVYLLRTVVMHLLGHTWGEQRGGSGWGYPETLDYDAASVMHRYVANLVEDGWGIHASDAYLIRRQYQNQASILTPVDVGVESYYAQAGLHNATTDLGAYVPGQSITVSGITVENMAYGTPTADVRLRLYLSPDRNITTSDVQLGTYWYWTSFNPEAYWAGDVTTTIPAGVAPGTYYVGAILTHNGFTTDPQPWNNKTTLFDTITVGSGVVTADFSGTPLAGRAPLSVDFTDLSTGSPTSWAWDFGDGGTDTTQNPTHLYAAAGRYTVTLTASTATASDTETKVGYVLVRTTEEIVTGAGPGPSNAPVVKSWDHSAPPATVASFTAYGSPQYGANVASVDVAGGGALEILTGPGPGVVYGPQIRGFQPDGTAMGKINFYSYGTLKFGAHPGGGELDGDGHQEILTSPGPGAVFGPHIRGWNFDAAALTAIAKINFFAYQTLRYGARQAGGDADQDLFAEIVTGAGAGAVFGPHVRAFDYDGTAVAVTPVSLFAFATGQYGASVAAGDTDGDGRESIIACHGPDATANAEVRGFDWSGGVSQVFAVAAFTSFGGAEVAAGDLDADGIDELIAAPGWGTAAPSDVAGFTIAGGVGNPIPGVTFSAYVGQSYGVKLAVGDTGTP